MNAHRLLFSFSYVLINNPVWFYICSCKKFLFYRMSLLSYLPEYKQHEIGKILEIIKELAKPEKVILFGSHASREEKKEKAQGYFDTWFPQGRDFLDGSVYHESKRQLRVGAFSLHQAAESFYNTALLVFTGYKPKTHHLERLRNYAKHISPELYGIFHKPALSEQECYFFDLLRRSYIDARYKLDYPITVEELRILIDKVSRMQEVVGRICREKIARMG